MSGGVHSDPFIREAFIVPEVSISFFFFLLVTFCTDVDGPTYHISSSGLGTLYL